MKTLFTREEHTLQAGQMLSGVAVAANSLQVVHGHVWLTVEGELIDYWLAAGDTLLLPAGRRVVLEAEGVASIVKTTSQAKAPASIWARLAASLSLPGQAAHC